MKPTIRIGQTINQDEMNYLLLGVARKDLKLARQKGSFVLAITKAGRVRVKFDPQSRTYSVSTVGERMKATTVIGYLVSNYMVVSIDGDQNKRAIPVVLSADPVYFDGILAQPSCFSPLTPEIKHALSLP